MNYDIGGHLSVLHINGYGTLLKQGTEDADNLYLCNLLKVKDNIPLGIDNNHIQV